MYKIVIGFLLCLLQVQSNYVFPNKNALIEWDNNEKYDINLSILDSDWNSILNYKIVQNQISPFNWTVPNTINNYTFFNKNLLFIQNNSVIDVQNINNYGVLINKNIHNYDLKSNYDCEYLNLSLNNINNFTIYDNILILNNSFFGIYDVTITSNDRNLLVYQIINVTSVEEENEYNVFDIVLICILGICGIAVLYLILYLTIYALHSLCGINLLNCCYIKKKNRKSRIHPNLPTINYNNKTLRRRYSTSDTGVSPHNMRYNFNQNENFRNNTSQYEYNINNINQYETNRNNINQYDNYPNESFNNVFI